MEEREKRYVPVIVRFEADGKLRPLEIQFDEAHRYPVDKILDVAGQPVRVLVAWEIDIPAVFRGKNPICGLKRAAGS